MSFPDAALIFPERHVELPMQIVFDAPMIPHGLGKTLSREIPAEDVVADFEVVLAIPPGVAENDPDRAEFLPPRAIGQIVRDRTEVVVADLFPAVPFFLRVVAAHLGAGEIILQMILEESLDS